MKFWTKWVKHVVILGALVILFWQTWDIVIRQFRLLPFSSVSSIEMILTNRLEPDLMATTLCEAVIKDVADYLTPKGVKIVQIPANQQGNRFNEEKIQAEMDSLNWKRMTNEEIRNLQQTDEDEQISSGQNGWSKADQRKINKSSERVLNLKLDEEDTKNADHLIEIFQESNQQAVLTIVYETIVINGKTVKKYIDFYGSSKLIVVLQELNGYVSESYARKQFYFWRGRFQKALKFDMEDYNKRRMEFPDMVYSFEELSYLFISGMLIEEIHRMTHLKSNKDHICMFDPYYKKINGVRSSKDYWFNHGLIPYSLYFCEHNKRICEEEAKKIKFQMALIFFLAFWLILQLIQPSLYSLVIKKAKKVNIQVRTYQIVGFLFSQAIWSVFPVSRSRMKKAAKSFCYTIKKQQIESTKAVIALQSEAVVRQLKNLLGEEEFANDQYLNMLMQMAAGKRGKRNKSLAYHQNALRLLQATLKKLLFKVEQANLMTESDKQTVNAVFSASRRPKIEWKRTSRRELLLVEVERHLPKTATLELDDWSVNKLDNLRLTLIILRSMGSEYVPMFLSKPDFEEHICDKQTKFMKAIVWERPEEIRRILEENGDSTLDEELEEDLSLPSDLRIVIIAGNKLVGRKVNLVQSLQSLGPKNVKFIDVNQFSKAADVLAGDPINKLLVLSCIPHKYQYLVNRCREFTWVWIDEIINPRNFALEVARKFQKKPDN